MLVLKNPSSCLIMMFAGLLALLATAAPVADDQAGAGVHLIEFDEPGLLDWQRTARGIGGALVRDGDFHTAQQALGNRQQILVNRMSEHLDRPLRPSHFYQVLHNGIAMALTEEEARRLAVVPGVRSVRRERHYRLATWRGPTFIGADAIWTGSGVPEGNGLRGEGRVAAVLDTGLPGSTHPSFADDPTCGHGTQWPIKVLSALDCAATDDQGLCNGPDPVDTLGHGTHVAATLAGNRIDASASPPPNLPTGFTELSGVAPCAHLRSYKVCPSNSCPESAILAGINSVMLHADVDVLNFSISGGLSPWTDNDRRKLELVDAGIVVAASAGNTSAFTPDPIGQVNHRGPWVMSVAATNRDYNAAGQPIQGDVLAPFSLRGPTPSPLQHLQKPDIAAPGVTIYAAVPGGYELFSGTSMASPHVAGAAVLVAQARPNWTAVEIMSALRLSAVPTGFADDGVTPWNGDDVGNGRIDLTRAALAGLVMDESRANFLAARPTSGGDVRDLNLPALRDLDCTPSCSWTRTVRNTLDQAGHWIATGVSDDDLEISVEPAEFQFNGDSAETLELTVTAVPLSDLSDRIAFGKVVLTEQSGGSPELILAVAIQGVGGPDISLTPSAMEVLVEHDQVAVTELHILNNGSGQLAWSVASDQIDNARLARQSVADTEILSVPDFAIAPDQSAIEFILPAGLINPGRVTGLSFHGSGLVGGGDWASDLQMTVVSPDGRSFMVGGYQGLVGEWDFQGPGSASSTTYSSHHDGIFGPEGVADEGDWIVRFRHDWSGGSEMQWSAVTLALHKLPDLCRSPTALEWLTIQPDSGTTAGGQSTQVALTFDPSGLAPGNHSGRLCVTSNAVGRGLAAVDLNLSVLAVAGPDQATIRGRVQGLGYCDQQVSGLASAVVSADTGHSAASAGSGDYQLVVPTDQGPITVTAEAPGHLPQTIIDIEPLAGEILNLDFELRSDQPCADLQPESISQSLSWGEQVTRDLLLTNQGAAVLDWQTDQAPAIRSAGRSINLVADGGLELGTPSPVWSEFSTNFSTPLCTLINCGSGGGSGPRSGLWWAWFGGIDALEQATLSQRVHLPTADAAELRFWLKIPSAATTGILEVFLGDNLIVAVDQDDAPDFSQYREVVVDISAFADDGEHELRFVAHTQPGGITSFFVDDVMLQVFQAPEPCEHPAEVAWLSVDPDAGSVDGDDDQVIEVGLDSTGLVPGYHRADLCFSTSDNERELIVVPVELEVDATATTAIIEGQVDSQDSCLASQSALAGAVVELDTVGGQLFHAVTDAAGGWAFGVDASDAPVQITISAPGHATRFFAGITPEAGQVTRVDAALELAAACATVEPMAAEISLEAGENGLIELTIGNVDGSVALDWTLSLAHALPADDGSTAYQPELDEVLAVPDFSVSGSADGGPVETFLLPGGVLSTGSVVGFTFAGSVAGIDQSEDRASDLRLDLISPAGVGFAVGGFSSPSNPWQFQGSGSSSDGHYVSSHFNTDHGTPIFGPGGVSDQGAWTLNFNHDWNSQQAGTMHWSGVEVTLHKITPAGCGHLAELDWLSVDPQLGQVDAGDSQPVSVAVETGNLDEGIYRGLLCVATSDSTRSHFGIEIVLQLTPAIGRVFTDRFESVQ
jgi:subtilisin family serine protease